MPCLAGDAVANDPDRKGAPATQDRKRRGSMSYCLEGDGPVQVAVDLTTRNPGWAEGVTHLVRRGTYEGQDVMSVQHVRVDT